MLFVRNQLRRKIRIPIQPSSMFLEFMYGHCVLMKLGIGSKTWSNFSFAVVVLLICDEMWCTKENKRVYAQRTRWGRPTTTTTYICSLYVFSEALDTLLFRNMSAICVKRTNVRVFEAKQGDLDICRPSTFSWLFKYTHTPRCKSNTGRKHMHFH